MHTLYSRNDITDCTHAQPTQIYNEVSFTVNNNWGKILLTQLSTINVSQLYTSVFYSGARWGGRGNLV